MQIQTVGILSPGDMGQAIADVLNQHGLSTSAALDERSDVYDGLGLRTRQLAAAANIQCFWVEDVLCSPNKRTDSN